MYTYCKYNNNSTNIFGVIASAARQSNKKANIPSDVIASAAQQSNKKANIPSDVIASGARQSALKNALLLKVQRPKKSGTH